MEQSSYGQPSLPPIIELYPCPRCGAGIGQPCVSIKGIETRRVAIIHAERIPPERIAADTA